jgi:hypothetical protein
MLQREKGSRNNETCNDLTGWPVQFQQFVQRDKYLCLYPHCIHAKYLRQFLQIENIQSLQYIFEHISQWCDTRFPHSVIFPILVSLVIGVLHIRSMLLITQK